MQYIDLRAQQKRIRAGLEKSYLEILDHGRYIMGPEIDVLEKKLADYSGAKHVVSCSNGTDALSMALMALNIGAGDAVFTTAFSFYATCETIMLCGATPIFVDIEADTFNIDVEKLEAVIEKTISAGELNAKAIMTVDLFGLPCDYKKIRKIANKYNLKIIEDAAQSFGGEYFSKKACNLADIGCTSFFPAKPLGCYGDGGAVFVNDEALFNVLKSIRIHGKGVDKYDNVRVGLNARMDTVQAGVLIEKLKIFDDELKSKTENFERYGQYLNQYVDVPSVKNGYKTAIAQYTIVVKGDKRDALAAHLKAFGVPTMIYYQTALPFLKATAHLKNDEADFPVAVDMSKRVLSLPMHAYMTDGDFKVIFDAFDAFYR
jgi:UDP-2-acetamido-2-deoxy-ribo-hexuluronate aminotransferase